MVMCSIERRSWEMGSRKRKVVDLDVECSDDSDQMRDTFNYHFASDREFSMDEIEIKLNRKVTTGLEFPILKSIACSSFTSSKPFNLPDGKSFNIKSTLAGNLASCNDVRQISYEKSTQSFSELQTELFCLLNEYRDFYSPCQTLDNVEEFRVASCLHVLNHVLKSRSIVLKNNATLKRLKDEKETSSQEPRHMNQSVCKNLLECDDDNEEFGAKFKDQAFIRTRVLFLTPFRSGAIKIVNVMADFLFGSSSKGLIMNRKRLEKEYGYEVEDDEEEKDKPRFQRPRDFERLFSGNTDDCFRLNISVAKKSLKLYVPNEYCDICIASPLGIRTATGNEDQKDFDSDFLSSIEIVVCELADIFLMQNWSHVLHIFQHLNQRPAKVTSVHADLSRIRDYVINDKSKFYRQTVVFSRIDAPEVRAIFSKFCQNIDGLAMACSFLPSHPAISRIKAVVSQAFHRFTSTSPQDDADSRFEFFCRHLLPDIKTSKILNRLLIFVPSYFDFVRLRNLFKSAEHATDLSFVQVCEYSSTEKGSRARDLFFHGKKHIMLYTERFHFFKRYVIRGVRHVLFYQLPLYSEFYTDVCDWTKWSRDDLRRLTSNGDKSMMKLEAVSEDSDEEANKTDETTNLPIPTCTVLFSKYDALRLGAVLGSDKATLLLTSDHNVHVFEEKS